MKSQLIDQKPPKKCCGLLSVRLMTSLMCTLLIIITTTSGLAVIFHFSIKATSEIAGRHALGITHKTKVELETSLRAPVNRASGWQYAFTRGTRPLPKDYPQTQNSTWFKDYWHTITAGMRGSRFNYILVSMNFDDGNRVFCRGLIDDLTRKDADELFLCRLLTWKEGYETDKNMSGNELTRTFKRYDYSLVFESIGTSNVDPRRSFIYNWPPRKPGSNRWTNVLLDGRLSVPVIGVCSIIYNETGVLLGVITIGLPLNHIVKLIESIVTTENSVIILIDNEDLLLGSSYYKPHMTINRISKTSNTTSSNKKAKKNCLTSHDVIMCRESITTYEYPPLRELQNSQPEIIDFGTHNKHHIITLNDENYFVVVAAIETANAAGMSWRVILFLSVNDIMGGVIRGRDLAIYISLGITIISVIVSYFFVTLLLHPLNAIAEEMYLVATMQDMDNASTTAEEKGQETNKNMTEPRLSILSEIAILQFAFNTTRAELFKVKSFLPQSVLAQLYGGDDFSDEGDVCNDNASRHDTISITSLDHSNNDLHSVGNRSRRNSGDSGSIKSSNSGSHQSVVLNTAMSLNNRRLSMMSLNIVGYHATISDKDDYRISRIQTALVTAISSACSEHRGVMDGFQGDHFLASFNAVTSVGNHALQAVYAAHTACEAAKTMHTPLVVSAGVASGQALVGNMGSVAVKRFTILGHVVSTAVTLERLAKRYRVGGGVLAGGVAITDVENFFDVLTVDVVPFPISTSSNEWRTRVAAVMSPKSATSDEWMYELQEGSKKSRYGDANLAFAAFLEGNNAEASRIVEQLFDGKHDPDSVSVGEALKKLMTMKPAIDGKGYVCPMTDFYLDCVLPNGNTAARNMPSASDNPYGSSNNREFETSGLKNICSVDLFDESILSSKRNSYT